MSHAALDDVIAGHVQEASSLCEARMAQVRLADVNLPSLRRLDDRLLAHFDALAVAGEAGWRLLDAELESPSRGASFAFVVRVLEQARVSSLDRIFGLCNDAPVTVD